MYVMCGGFDLKNGYRTETFHILYTWKLCFFLKFFHQSKAFVNTAPSNCCVPKSLSILQIGKTVKSWNLPRTFRNIYRFGIPCLFSRPNLNVYKNHLEILLNFWFSRSGVELDQSPGYTKCWPADHTLNSRSTVSCLCSLIWMLYNLVLSQLSDKPSNPVTRVTKCHL